ncbi:hypothetical protein KKF81_04045 [Candidatus Micrarchaeota archaeon]|nr:hypothetical protein [Candidatus Micrarchaeota archaeon]MBU1166096.1 hypothetical protein [Candidatus Micrarchaeota archaeon]MBU1887167.1 hypothetical protein [Candidatus Micrarchaeota archaeon]
MPGKKSKPKKIKSKKTSSKPLIAKTPRKYVESNKILTIVKNESKTKSKSTDESGKLNKEIIITPRLRRIWIQIRRNWGISRVAFTNNLSLLNDGEANNLYNLVIHSLYKNSYVDILREIPGLRGIIRTEDDRYCMHDIYQILSWRLDKTESPPKTLQIKLAMRGGIGRESGAQL